MHRIPASKDIYISGFASNKLTNPFGMKSENVIGIPNIPSLKDKRQDKVLKEE